VILTAGLLVLAGLGLFVAGILTGVTVLYWGCVAACVVAAVLLIVARRQMNRQTAEPASAPDTAAPSKDRLTGTAPTEEPAAAPADEQAPAGEPAADLPDPEVEEVEVTDLLMVVDLKDEVLVVDEHPRYHVAGCRWVGQRETIPLPVDEARTDGFTPCAVCSPDRTLAERARARR
jgi:hypothetical protein